MSHFCNIFLKSSEFLITLDSCFIITVILPFMFIAGIRIKWMNEPNLFILRNQKEKWIENPIKGIKSEWKYKIKQ